MLQTTEMFGISMVEQKNRRRLVATIYVVLLASILTPVLIYPYLTTRFVSLVLQFFLLPLFIAWKIFTDMVGRMEMVLQGRPAKPITLGLFARRDQEDPDERDVLVRNAAYFKAYRVLALYLMLLIPATQALMEFGYMRVLVVLIFALFVILTTLPQAILLWTEPDVPVEA